MKRSFFGFLILALVAIGLIFFLRQRAVRAKAATTATGASLNVGKTESRNNMTSGTSSSSSDNSTFNARRVLLLTNSNPHPLSQRINSLVAQGLKDSAQIEKIETGNLSSGAEAPDLFVLVEVIDLKEEGVLSRSLKATVTASLGGAPWESRHHVQSHGTPPVVQFNWNATLDHESTFSGLRTDRYKESATDIAAQLLKGMTNEIKNLSKKFPPLPGLPAEFYGPYEPVADFAFLKEAKAQRAYSYYGLFTHNDTFWKFQTATNLVPQLQRIADQFEAAGWKADSTSLTNTYDHYLRFRQKDAELEIFRAERNRLDPTALDKKENAIEFIAHYRKSFSDAEREAALEKLFTTNSPLETLLPFQNSFFQKQRERYYAILEKAPASSPRSSLLLAEVYLQRKNTNAATKMLLRAKALDAMLDSSDLESKIDALAKKISPKAKLKLEVSPEIYRELGFLEITNSTQSFELERPFGQPVLLFTEGDRGPRTFSLNIHAPRKGSYPWSMIERQGYGRSSSSSEFALPANGNWQQSFTFDKRSLIFKVSLLPDKRGFKYNIETK
jgi:hypothetical protein